ncbi:hypothetical protein [Allochromatium palmeri]|uniref:PEP-CTERM sorting domain-containing protein n=1 Tax=Allochromatium palmeri TaxID=231048 RepID=A0A6N8E5U2_9GAMM|nr:hypothetical protein [Allochromatium palmeri]MTW19562.1 hypothetical protein [Allochromatium palmeri]
MFAKNTLASAVAAAIGVSAVGVAQADTLFFPYVALSQTVTTIVSVINTTDDNWSNDGPPQAAGFLHYRLYYKNVANGEGLTNSCEEYNEYLSTSRNDIQTIDLSGVYGSDTLGVLFNDPGVNNPWVAANRDYALGRYVTPARGYLTVDNSDGTTWDTNGDDGDTMAGEAFVFEFGSGAAWGYQAYQSNSEDLRWAASQSPTPVALMPFAGVEGSTSDITTAFFVTPVSGNQTPDVENAYRARVEYFTTTRGDLFDRDENVISGTLQQDVVCVGRVDATSLLSDGTLVRLGNGGWANLWSYPVLDGQMAAFDPTRSTGLISVSDRSLASDGAVVIKLEYSVGGMFNGESMNDTFNNAIMYGPDANNPWPR